MSSAVSVSGFANIFSMAAVEAATLSFCNTEICNKIKKRWNNDDRCSANANVWERTGNQKKVAITATQVPDSFGN